MEDEDAPGILAETRFWVTVSVEQTDSTTAEVNQSMSKLGHDCYNSRKRHKVPRP